MILKRQLFILIALILASGMVFSQNSPNIIVFMVDDMGWQDTSVPFADRVTEMNKRYKTPNMERLAAQGTKFTNAYANSVCTPTRVSFLTGMSAARHRVTNWTSPEKDKLTDYADDLLTSPSWNLNGISSGPSIPATVNATPLPQLLKDAGYFTAHVGKAHWGPFGTPASNPRNLGFVVNIAGSSIGHPESYYGEENYGNNPGRPLMLNAVPGLGEYYGSDIFLTEALTLEAIKAVADPIKYKKPFFLYLSHYAVHTPIEGDPRFLKKYLDKGVDSIEAKYASLIEGMDKSLGDVMDMLEEKKIADNTIIMFISDNGGLSLVPPRGGEAYTHNYLLKAGKGSLYEGGIREPMLVKWPGVTKAGSVSGQNVHINDFFPTILEMAGIRNVSTKQTVDGITFIPSLKDPALKDDSRAIVWHYPNRWTSDESNAFCYASAIRQGDWKLIYLMKQKKLELYNLKDDLGEKKDLSAANPKKTKELAAKLTEMLKSYKAQMPIYKSSGLPVAWPDGTTTVK
ncbi:MAG: sulfatase [Daejeonella sp.]